MRSAAVVASQSVLLAMLTSAGVGGSTQGSLIWPQPQSVSISGAPAGACLSTEFVVTAPLKSHAAIDDAIRRYSSVLEVQCPAAGRTDSLLRELVVKVANTEAVLCEHTNYSYAFSLAKSAAAETFSAAAAAATQYGAVYALDTFVQLLDGGCCLPGSGIMVQDEPMYSHRGIMLDAGSRYIPVEQIERQLDVRKATAAPFAAPLC